MPSVAITPSKKVEHKKLLEAMDMFMTLIVLRIPGICKGARVVWYRRGNPKKAGIYF